MGFFNPLGIVSLDTETTGLLPFCGDRPYAVSMCDENGETWFVEWPVDPFTRVVTPVAADLKFISLVLRKSKAVELFNANFDLRMLWTIPELRADVVSLIERKGFREVYFMAKLCYSQEVAYGLKWLAKKYSHIPDDDEKALKEQVRKARAYGRKKGWKLSKYGNDPAAADTWMARLWHQEAGKAAEGAAEVLETYAILDAVRTRVLGEMYWELMTDPFNADPAVEEFYHKEIAAFPAVWEMQERGMSISRERCQAELDSSQKRAAANLKKLRSLTRNPLFNPSSPLQLCAWLYGPKPKGLGLNVNKKTEPSIRFPQGSPSTDSDALREHLDHPAVQVLMNYRSADKGARDFFAKYLRMMQPHWDPAGRCAGVYVLHPSIRQVGPITGRTSSSDPNLQQVGDATKQYRGVNPIQARGPFCPTPGYCVYGVDWAQQESRIFADLANIPEMLGPIFSGRDLNTENANRIWGGKENPAAIRAMALSLELGRDVPTSQEVLDAWKELGWSPEKAKAGVYSSGAFIIAERWLAQHDYKIVAAEKAIGKSAARGRGKTVLFTLMYGGGPKALVGNLYCTMEEAKQFRADMHKALPGMQPFMDAMVRQARRDGHIYTAFGRRIDINPEMAYQCVDYIVQGTASDCLKKAITEIHRYYYELGHSFPLGSERHPKARMIMPIHDELMHEIHKSVASKVLLRGVRNIMQDTTGSKLRVPMLAEVKRYAHSWAEGEVVKL